MIAIKFWSNQTIEATLVAKDVIVNTNDTDKIFKESDNWNKDEIVNTYSENVSQLRTKATF